MNWTEIAKSKDVETVRAAIEKLDVNERDAQGRTPLMVFLTNRMPLEAVELLIENGADLETEDKLGDTALKKAVKFKQFAALSKLIQAGAALNSPRGILATAWNEARKRGHDTADLLLETPGAVRLTLTEDEQAELDDIIYEESMEDMGRKISEIRSTVLLHAVVSGYNWDDGPQPMLAAFLNPACAEVTMLDQYELMEGDYWLDNEAESHQPHSDDRLWRDLAERLRDRLGDKIGK